MASKLYTDEQYNEYLKLINKLEKEKNLTRKKELNIYIINWINFYNLNDIAIEQMNLRISRCKKDNIFY